MVLHHVRIRFHEDIIWIRIDLVTETKILSGPAARCSRLISRITRKNLGDPLMTRCSRKQSPTKSFKDISFGKTDFISKRSTFDDDKAKIPGKY